MSSSVSVFSADRLEIRVRLQHPGAARSERAVDLALDAAHREALVAVVDTRSFGMSMASLSGVSRSIIQTRSGSLPSSTTFSINAIVSGGDPASFTVVNPLESASRDASSITLRASASFSAGVRLRAIGAPARG